MSKLDEAKEILEKLQLPIPQQNGLCCCTLLAMTNIREDVRWKKATNEWLRIHDVIVFSNTHNGTSYAENSRETFRKQAIHHFRNAAIIEDNGQPTNSPNYRYRISNEALALIKSFGTRRWDKALKSFQGNHEALIQKYATNRIMQKQAVQINDTTFTFSPGRHNELQKAIIEQFAPRFAPASKCLYVGDTTDKDLVKDEEILRSLGFSITLHDKMPDVVLYSEEKQWLYFVEAVTSVGPMEPKRIQEIKEMTANVHIGKVFVTAFPDFKTFKRFSDKLAWETEVWIAEIPDHMIHMNGDKFLGPRQ